MNLRVVLLCCLALAGWFAAPAWASEAVTDTLQTVEDCLQCHAIGADLGKFKVDLLKLHNPAEQIDYRIDAQVFAESNHAKLVCRVCHVIGKEVYPHLPEAKGNYFDCLYCHQRDATDQKFDVAKITADFTKSVHVTKQGEKFTCYTCHDPHVFNITDPEKPIKAIIEDDNTVCQRCHDDPNQFEPMTDRVFPVIERTHRDWLPNTQLHWSGVRCVECHTAHTETFTHEILPKEQSEEGCVSCHQRDSILLTTLYKHRAQQERSMYGFGNAVILGQNYMIGVTRHPLLDTLSIVILGLAVAGVLGHGLLRGIFSKRRVLKVIHRVYLYPGWLRIWHWLNALLFVALIATGISMHFSDAEQPVVPFGIAAAVHNVAGLALVACYVFFLAGTFFSKNRRHYLVSLPGLFGRIMGQARFYLIGIMRGEGHPFPATEESKFNPLQQLAYVAVMFFMMPILTVTGILLQAPDLAPDRFLGAGGIWPMAVIHSVAGFLATVFMIVHIYLGSTGDTATTLYKNMISGWHEEFAHGGADTDQPKPVADNDQE